MFVCKRRARRFLMYFLFPMLMFTEIFHHSYWDFIVGTKIITEPVFVWWGEGVERGWKVEVVTFRALE